ncbi:MAG: M28 family peptidase [Rhodothermales bacterium]
MRFPFHPCVAFRSRVSPVLLTLVLLPLSAACSQPAPPPAEMDTDRMLQHVEVLSSDAYEGRKTGTPAAERTRAYLVGVLEETGAVPCSDDGAWEHPAVAARRDNQPIVNVLAQVPGTSGSDIRMVVSAHYDHLGIRDGEIYNGADDNASGTAAVLELARYFAAHPPEHTIVFALFDFEEGGLNGARAFVESPCGSGTIALNVNLDMVSRSEAGELYASGTRHWPSVRPLLEMVAVPEGVTLLYGHDEPGTGSDDWTMSSDHGPFHAAGIPFVYFGVEDHDGYHRPSDDFDQITPEFYRSVGVFLSRAIRTLNTGLGQL